MPSVTVTSVVEDTGAPRDNLLIHHTVILIEKVMLLVCLFVCLFWDVTLSNVRGCI